MPNVGPLELVVVLIIALVVLGPKRLPEVGRSLGNGIREFKESLTMEHNDDDEDHLDVEDVEEPPKALAATAATAPVAPPAEAGAEPADPDKPQT